MAMGKKKCTKCGERAMFGVNDKGECLPCRNEARLAMARAHNLDWNWENSWVSRQPVLKLDVWDRVE